MAAVKIPKPFHKPVPEKKFRRTILKRIYLDKERKFLLGLLKQDEAGRYLLKQELTKAEASHLKALMKSVKKNKGMVTGWKMALLGLIIGVVLIFNILFLDRLAEGAAEQAMEGVFQAQVDLAGLDIGLLSGSISFASLTVADKGSPMRNLFELGDTELRLNLWELLKKKFVIERAVCTGIALDTERTESGALASAPADGEGSQPDKGGAVAGMESLLQDADPQALLKAQQDRLKSPAYIEEVNSAYREATEIWPERIDSLSTDLDQARTAAEKIAGIRPASIDTVQEAVTALGVIEDNLPPLEKAVATVEARSDEFNRDRVRLTRLQQEIREAMAADYALLESIIAAPGGELRGVAGSAAENILRARIGDWYGRIRKISTAAENLKGKKQTPEAARTARREGETVFFPVAGVPRFMIQEFRIATSREASSDFLDLSAADISSDPDLIDRPTLFSFETSSSGVAMSGKGTLDLRTAAQERFTLAGSLDGGSFSLKQGLEALGIERLDAGLAGTMNLKLQSDQQALGEGTLQLSPLDPQFSGGQDPVSQAVEGILADLDEASFAVSFTAEGEDLTSFQVETDLDRLLSQRVGEYLRRRGEELADELQAALREELAASLEENQELRDLFGESGAGLAGLVREAESLEAAAAEQQRRIEARVDELRKQAEARADELKKQAEEEAQKQAENLLEDAGRKLKLPF